MPLRTLNDARARLGALAEGKALPAVDVLWQDYGERGMLWFHALAYKVYPLDAAWIFNAANAGIVHSPAADDPRERAAAALLRRFDQCDSPRLVADGHAGASLG